MKGSLKSMVKEVRQDVRFDRWGGSKHDPNQNLLTVNTVKRCRSITPTHGKDARIRMIRRINCNVVNCAVVHCPTILIGSMQPNIINCVLGLTGRQQCRHNNHPHKQQRRFCSHPTSFEKNCFYKEFYIPRQLVWHKFMILDIDARLCLVVNVVGSMDTVESFAWMTTNSSSFALICT